MTNIDFDHPDYFKDVHDVFNAFQEMAHNVKKAIIAWGDDPYLRDLKADVPIYYYGFSKNDDIYMFSGFVNINSLGDGFNDVKDGTYMIKLNLKTQ